MKRQLILISLTLLIAALFGSALLAGYRSFSYSMNIKRLEASISQWRDRAELAVDRAIIGMGDALIQAESQCDDALILLLRRATLADGGLLELEIHNNGEVCASFGELLSDDWLMISDVVVAGGVNSNFTFRALESLRGLTIDWAQNDGVSLRATMSVDWLMFDVLPGALRADAHASFVLRGADGGAIVLNPQAENGPSEIMLEAMSTRYPIGVRVQARRAAVATWNVDTPPAVRVTVGGLILVFAYLAALILTNRLAPIDPLRDAIASGEIQPWFQPCHCARSGEILAFEMLARWVRPDGVIVPPNGFIPEVERRGLEAALMASLLRRAGSQFMGALSSNIALRLAINVSPHLLQRADFPAFFQRTLEASNLKPTHVIVEVTERHAPEDMASAAANAATLREIGVAVAIDDVGSGHNGLALIKNLGADELKIDKLFVDQLADDPDSQVVVARVIQIAHDLGMSCAAEGVETPEQAALLAKLGADKLQGWLYAKAMPGEEALDYLMQQHAKAKQTQRVERLDPHARHAHTAALRLR